MNFSTETTLCANSLPAPTHDYRRRSSIRGSAAPSLFCNAICHVDHWLLDSLDETGAWPVEILDKKNHGGH